MFLAHLNLLFADQLAELLLCFSGWFTYASAEGSYEIMDIRKLTARCEMKVGSMSGRHGLYRLGYIRATMVNTVRCYGVSLSKS